LRFIDQARVKYVDLTHSRCAIFFWT